MSQVWSVGIFAEQPDYNFKLPLKNVIKTFDAKRIRIRKKHIHTYADPFLFVYGDALYLFAEVQEIGGAGYINTWKTTDLNLWEDIGCVLKEEFHCSYPFVFKCADDSDVYIVPETGASNQTFIYEFCNFPLGVTKKFKVLDGFYADSNIYYKDGFYFLSTTEVNSGEFRLFYSHSLDNANWHNHPLNPITKDKTVSRNGGGFVEMDGRLYRIAQNSSSRYGEGIVVLEVMKLNEKEYEEVIINHDFRPFQNLKWQKKGRHHLSIVPFQGKQIIAMDGLQNDYLINKGINLLYKFI